MRNNSNHRFYAGGWVCLMLGLLMSGNTQAQVLNPGHLSTLTDGTDGALLNGAWSVYISGNYAYVASTSSNALEIVDITDPASPVHTGSLSNGTGGALLGSPRSVYVSGNYAYVASYGSTALEIVDVTDPANPVHKGSLSDGVGGAMLYGLRSVYVAGNYAYVASSSNFALEIVDVTDPANPVHIGSLTDGTGGAKLNGPWSVYVSGNYAYVASTTSDALEIVDVTDPANPVHKGSLSDGTGGALLDAPQSVYISGNYAYVVGAGNALEIVDVTNPANPVHKGSLINGSAGASLNAPLSVYVSGNFAYVASSTSNALEIVDVSDPANPAHYASLSDGAGGALLNSPHSVWVSGNYAYVTSTISDALEIIHLSAPAISNINPPNGYPGTPVTINGINFDATPANNVVEFNGLAATVTASTSTGITTTVPVGAAPGKITVEANGPVATSIIDFDALDPGLVPNPSHLSALTDGTGGASLNGPISVFVSGNYAYIASAFGDALEIVDVTDPTNPVHKGSLSDGTGGAQLDYPASVYVSGNYAYVASVLANQFEIVDVTDPANPVHKGNLGDGTGGALLDTPYGVYISGHYAYVASYLSNALEIVDVSDPANPVHKGSLTDGAGGALLQHPIKVYVSGNYAYVASNLSDALEIVDVTDPANPVHKGSLSHGVGGALLDAPYAVCVSGNYAYVASSSSNAFQIVDVTDPANPVYKGSLSNGSGGALLITPRSVYVSGNYAYIGSLNSNAVEIVDVSDPANPVHRGSLGDGTGGALLNQPYSVYVSGHLAYVTSFISNALDVIELARPDITDFSPASGAEGASVSIMGINFDTTPSNNTVKFNGVTASVTASTATSVTATVPLGATTGKITVEVDGMIATSVNDFTVVPPPMIANFNPINGHEGTTVIIKGTNFDPTPSNNVVKFNGIAATVTTSTATSITTTVPAGATTGKITVEVNSLLETSGIDFDVLDPNLFPIPSHEGSITNGTGNALLNGAQGVFVAGNYAYVVGYGSNALEIVDISDPSSPSHAARLTDGTAGALLMHPTSVFVSGDYAYVVSPATSALEIVDVSNPTSPLHKASLTTGTGGAILSGAQTVFVSGNYAYVAASIGALEIINITDPSTPVHEGSISDGSGGAILLGAYGVFVAGDYAYVTSANDNALEIVDISDPAAPVHKGSLTDGAAGAQFNFPRTVFVSGDYAYIVSTGTNSLEIIDVSNPAAPAHVSSISETEGAAMNTPFGLFVSGNYAYVPSTTGNWLEIVDVSNPSAPAHQAILTSGTDGALLGQPFAVFVSGDYAYVASYTSNALEVVALKTPGITGFTPANGPEGTSVTITGSNFDPTQVNNIVKFGGITAAVTASTATNITVTVPASATTGKITVEVDGHTGTSDNDFTVIQRPTITGFSPASGPIGTAVTITGSEFDPTPANNIVYFGGVQTVVNTGTSTTLEVQVPTGFTYQPISVLKNGLQGFSAAPFVVTFDGSAITSYSFDTKIDELAGTGADGVAIGDLDGDGKLDLAVANYFDNTVSILRNTTSGVGSITYAAKMDIAAGTHPRGVSIGDLDGDGALDLAVANEGTSNVSVIRNTSSAPGTISFATKIDFDAILYPQSVSIGDLDADGKADLVVSNGGNPFVSVFKNTSTGPGTIGFDPKVDLSTSGNALSATIGDLDGDGKLDIVTGNYGATTGSVSLFRNTSSGTLSFATESDLAVGIDPYSVCLGDLDGDGLPDIAVANAGSNQTSVFRNTSTIGSVSFGAKQDYATGIRPAFVSMGDLDGDGKIDLAIANDNSSTVSVFRNTSLGTGTISFAVKQDFTAASQPQSVAIGDLDNDGKPDLATANYTGNDVSLLLNKVNPPPAISNFNPINGYEGTTVIITGSNFDSTPGNNIVKFNGTTATVTSATATSITTTVPAGGTPGKITVEVSAMTATSATDFDVIDAAIVPTPSHIASLDDGTGGALLNSPYWVSRSGDYVYVTSFDDNALEIVDVSDPASPVHAGGLADGTGGALLKNPRYVFVSGNYAYVASFGSSNALEIVDVTDPSSPTHSGSLTNGTAGALLNGPYSVAVSGSYAYVTSASNAVEIVDVSDPSAPTHAGSLTDGAGGALLDGPYSVFVSGNYAFVASYNSDALEIIDISDPSAPTHKGSLTNGTGGAVLDGPYLVFVSGNYAYVASYLSDALEIVDISDPAAPTHVASLGDGVGGAVLTGPVSVFVSGNYAYVSSFDGSALEVVDVTDPETPVHYATLDLPFNPYCVSVTGNYAYSANWGSNKLDIAALNTPAITTFNPNSGPEGISVTISGTNFDTTPTNNLVKLNGVTASVTTSSTTSLDTSVPSGATTGKITVEVNGFIATSIDDFTVTTATAPTITSFSPTSGPEGTAVTISGTNFDTTPANNTVKFNGTTATITGTPTTTTIVTSVPTGATTGKITVDVDGETATSTNDFTVTAVTAPTITSFNPTSGPEGTAVTISGTNFSTTPANNTVKFNGTTATITGSPTSTAIVTSVPTGATTGKITVEVGGEIATSSNDFTVTAGPVLSITGFLPLSGPEGTTVTITGTEFDPVMSNNTVKFNGTLASVTSNSTTEIVTSVPTGATTGPISVQVDTDIAISGANFAVTTTPDTSAPVITNNTSSTVAAGNDVQIMVTLTDPESGIASAKVLYRTIEEGGTFESADLIPPASGSEYSATISSSFVGALGLEYKYDVTNGIDLGSTSELFTVQLSSAAGVPIPYSSFGSGESNYRIVAVPLSLATNTVASVFDELMPYENWRWRMYHYESGSNKELNGSSVINAGQGYWLVIKDNTSLTSGAGTTVPASSEAPFSIQLVQGWNEIGNPYNFNLDWADVQAANPGLPGLRKWINTMVDGDELDQMEGGFVNATSPGTLVFPVVKNASVNGRTRSEKVMNPLDAPDWQVYLNLDQGEQMNRIAGVGMNEHASEDYDIYDGLTMPRFFGSYLEVNHKRQFNGSLVCKDVVPPSDTYEWDFDVATSGSEPVMTFSWDNSYFGDNDRELFLWDDDLQRGIDMRSQTHYSFDRNVSKAFKVFFGSSDFVREKTAASSLVLYKVWPNPAESEVNIAFSVPGAQEAKSVNIQVVDLTGRKVWSYENRFAPGYHQLTWKPDAEASGLYVVMVASEGTSRLERLLLK